jgi:hypothetical protein
MSMMEDFWLPRREGGKGTEITTLPGGQNLGELEDVKYFEKKLYKSLNVPVSRLNPESSGFSLGRASEITRDELKFAKFVSRMRNKFSDVFDQAMKVQCVLKGICTADEWSEFREHIYYDFIKDNNFSELKEAELMRDRLSLLQQVDMYTGKYFSQSWIQRNVLRLTDDEIKEMQKEIDKEIKEGITPDPKLMMQQPGVDGAPATPTPAPTTSESYVTEPINIIELTEDQKELNESVSKFIGSLVDNEDAGNDKELTKTMNRFFEKMIDDEDA